MGYEHKYGPDIARDYRNPLYMDVLTEQLPVINPGAKNAAIEEALHKLTNIEHGSVAAAGTLIQKNKTFTDWLQNGMEVSYQEKGETKTEIVRLIDYKNPSNGPTSKIQTTAPMW